MIDDLKIRSFRGIEQLEVPRCARVNVVVGRNGSGKSRLLEAAMALSFRANADVFPQLAKLRGVPPELPASVLADYYRDSFATRGFDEARVEGRIRGVTRSSILRRRPAESSDYVVPVGSNGSSAPAVAIFESEMSEGAASQPVRHHGYVLHDGRWWVPRARPLSQEPPIMLRTPKRLHSVVTLARNWSSVESKGGEARARVIDALRAIDAGIRELRVVALDNGVAQLRVDYGNLGLCPVELLGDGVAEALHYFTTVVHAAGGIVLVDEFGTPLDARNIDLVIRSVLDMAVSMDVQLWVSTHSLEVVDALLSATDLTPEDLLVLQMKDDARVTAALLDHSEAKALRNDLGFDLRRVA